MQSIEDKISGRIRRKGKRWVFSQHDFGDLGSRAAIDLALHRLVRKGVIRRVMRGIYDSPQFSKRLGTHTGSDIHQVADALARKFGWRIQPDRTAAENMLGLSTQVPAKTIYLSDGPSRTYRIGGTMLRLKRTAVKEAGFRYDQSALIVQALRSRGIQHVKSRDIETIRAWLPVRMRRKVLADTRTATDWVHAAIKRICREE
jgi:hypothetical protein